MLDPEAYKRLQEIGKGSYESIKEMVENLYAARENDDPIEGDNATESILNDALSIEIRNNWHCPGGDSDPLEYKILLSWGGPAVQIIGTLNEYCEPNTAHLETQDWFLPWTEQTDVEEKILLDYAKILLDSAKCFYFGE